MIPTAPSNETWDASAPGSQCEEDEVLARLIPGDGAYVDIGAFHAEESSNTLSLYRRGWRGLLIDPLPMTWYGLMLHRPGDHVYPVACFNSDGTASFRVCESVSTLRLDWPIQETDVIEVETRKLSTIMATFPEIRTRARLLSIDVEGCESQVLASNDWETFRPEVIVVEYRWYNADQPGVDISHEWDQILLSNGYIKHHQTTFNQIWVRG